MGLRFSFFLTVILFLSVSAQATDLNIVREKTKPRLTKELQRAGFQLGNPIFLRVFKQEKIVEVWVQEPGQRTFNIFKKYPICLFSGKLGPKLREGDLQAPEGFYDITRERLHPESNYHLAFNLGYPNKFDLARGRTGDFLMIHGGCKSEGCYAINDENMEELYIMAEAALSAGQEKIDVHIFPFIMTKKNFRFHAKSTWLPFWYSLKPAYDVFQANRIPPDVDVKGGRYKIKTNYND